MHGGERQSDGRLLLHGDGSQSDGPLSSQGALHGGGVGVQGSSSSDSELHGAGVSGAFVVISEGVAVVKSGLGSNTERRNCSDQNIS